MAIIDQFETFRHTDYSSSYTDYEFATFSGSFLTNDRKVIGNKTNNVIHGASLARYEMLYTTYINYVSGNVIGKNHSFTGFDSSNEIIYDSLMPSPVDFHLANSADFISNNYNFTSSLVLNSPAFNSGTAFHIKVANPNVTSSYINISTGSQSYTAYDVHWPTSFPFETKYRNLPRLQKIDNFLVKKLTLRLTDLGSEGNPTPLIPNKTSNIFTGEIAFIEQNLITNAIGFN